MMKDAVIVNVARTPLGKFRGVLASLEVPDLAAIPVKAVVEKAKLDPALVDDVIMGNLFASDWGNIARVTVLRAGFPNSISGITVDRQCSSSLNALGIAAALIQTNMLDIAIAAGVESYSQQPFYLKRPETAYPGAMQLLDFKVTPPEMGNPPMIITAENLAAMYKLTRKECDAFAVASHQKASKAWANGWFDEQVVPVTIPKKKGQPLVITMDECVRPDASMEAVSPLKPVMKVDGVVTAANSSPMNDGAAAVLLMSREKAQELGYKPLAVVKEFASAGCDPNIMGIGPVHATRKLLNRTGLKLQDIDYIELNEAFAAQSLACIKELGLDPDRVNVEGGAIAIGHPNGASGAVLAARMAYVLKHHNARRGLISFCCGGGQGLSMLLERDESCC